MYTLTRGPSKLATQRRTGPTQQPVESKVGEPRAPLPGAVPPPHVQPEGPKGVKSGGP
uniref:Uncharacterized protein n=1 Tax=Pavo cristatus TaxID=9049 RepID=A0A8C9LD98_PAVCR